ncbi:hypothetical protein ACHAQH_009063 [Verticillium albo-atrum]
MPPFEPPRIDHDMRMRWYRTAKPGFQDAEKLNQKYWHDYNTVTIPLRDMDDFFADACAAAQVAQDRGHLETLLAEQREARWQGLRKATSKIGLAAIYQKECFPLTAVRNATFDLSRSASLSSLLLFVSCVMDGCRDGWHKNEGDDQEHTSGSPQGHPVDDDVDYEDEFSYESNRISLEIPSVSLHGLQDDAYNAWVEEERALEVEEAGHVQQARQLEPPAVSVSDAATSTGGRCRAEERVGEQASDSPPDDNAPAQRETTTTEDIVPSQRSPFPPSPTLQDAHLITSIEPSENMNSLPRASLAAQADDAARRPTCLDSFPQAEIVHPADAPGSPTPGSAPTKKRPHFERADGEGHDVKRRK